MTRLERYQMRIAKKEERIAKENYFNSLTIWNALEVLLKKLNKIDYIEKVKEQLLKESVKYGYPMFDKKGKSHFQFEGIGNIIGINAYMFLIEFNVNRQTAFENEIKRRFKATYNLWEFELFDDCLIAFN